MIGTLLVRAEALADLEPVELRQHQVEHDEVDVLLREARERLLAVARLDDAEAVALERVGEELLDGVLVVDEQDGRGVGHGSACRRTWRGPTIAPRMAALPPRSARRRPRRGSLERPVNGRLYRGTWLLVGLPLLARPSASRPARCRRRDRAAAAFDGPRAIALASELSRPTPTARRAARAPRSGPLGSRPARRPTGCASSPSASAPTMPGRGDADARRTWSRSCPGARRTRSSSWRTATTSAPGRARTTTPRGPPR